MRRRALAGLVLAGCLGVVSSAAADDYFGASSGLATPIGNTADFANSGTTLEARWRHFNRGRSAFEFVLGFVNMGLEGEVQRTIARYDALMRTKNYYAQQQGGPGNGYLVSEYGAFDTYYGGANLLFGVLQHGRVAPFVSIGAALYNWRVPFRIKFFRTPFFGEQHPWETPALPTYTGVFPEEAIDFTKHETSGGINVAVGANLRLTTRLHFDAQARSHLIFSSGKGVRETGVDDQKYLDKISLFLMHAGLSYRF